MCCDALNSTNRSYEVALIGENFGTTASKLIAVNLPIAIVRWRHASVSNSDFFTAIHSYFAADYFI